MAGRLNPFAKLLAVLFFSIFVFHTWGLWSVLVLLSIVLLPTLSGHHLLKTMWKMKVMLITAFLIYVFDWMDGKSQLLAIGSAAKFLATIAAAALYIETTDLTELSASIGALLCPFIGKAAWKFASGVMMTIALFPIIFEAADEMLRARRARLGSFFQHPVRNLTDYIVSLMRILFQKIIIFQDALYARAYSPEVARTARSYEAKDYLFILCTALLALTTLFF